MRDESGLSTIKAGSFGINDGEGCDRSAQAAHFPLFVASFALSPQRHQFLFSSRGPTRGLGQRPALDPRLG
jgi:hypothetical protein